MISLPNWHLLSSKKAMKIRLSKRFRSSIIALKRNSPATKPLAA